MFYDIYLYTLCYYICCLLGACMRCTWLCSLKLGVTWRHRIDVAGLHPTAGARRPSSTVSLSSIPCTGSVFSTPWSFLHHWIERYHREQAGTYAANEPDRLCTWPDWFRPSPSMSRTSTWPPGPPEANTALRRTFLTAGKPRHPVYSPRLLFQRGRELGEKEEEVGGVLNSQWLMWIVL
jgi:hypothetical protein